MVGGLGYWRHLDGFQRDYQRLRWVDAHLGRDIRDAHRREQWQRWELGNLARDIETARERGAAEDATDLAYYAARLRHELAALEGSAG